MNEFTFEGSPVVDFLGRIPAVVVECPQAYARGTVLKLNVEVRVKSVRLEENKDGDLVRQHIFAVEDLSIANVVDAQDLARSLVGGSAAGHLALPAGTEEDADIERRVDVVTGEVTHAVA